MPLWKLSVTTLPEAEDAVAELLQTTFNQRASSYHSLEKATTDVAVYLKRNPNWTREKRSRLLAAIENIRSAGLEVGEGRFSLRQVRSEDWVESWKKHFKPIQIGSALLIRPSWRKQKSRKGQVTVVLDPGLSFGTGQHPTTSFCLEQLVEHRLHNQAQSFLDIGIGSGILAISAAKLGFAPVHAIDFDPDVVRIARSNARKNRVAHKIRIVRRDVSQWEERTKYSFICANLISTLLVAERDRILARLDEDGILVLAGILRTEFEKVKRDYECAGMKLIAARTENEWRSGAVAWERPEH